MIYDLSEEQDIVFARTNYRLVQVADFKSFYVNFHADSVQVLLYQIGGFGDFWSVAG